MYLTLDKGTMFGGKTSELIRRYNQYIKTPSLRILAIKHTNDTRYEKGMINSHDKKKIPCVCKSSLLDIDVEKWDVLLIDEAQWFPDLFAFIQKNFQKKVRVHVAGLNGDRDQRNFGDINLISPFCSEENIHYGMCSVCGNKAPFTIYLGKSEKRDIVGAEEYTTVCHLHLNFCPDENEEL